jgi:hypothetical protein
MIWVRANTWVCPYNPLFQSVVGAENFLPLQPQGATRKSFDPVAEPVEARGKDCSIAPGDTGRRTGAGAMKKSKKSKVLS